MENKYLDFAKKYQSDIIRAAISFAVILTLIFLAIFYRPNKPAVPSVSYTADLTIINNVISNDETPTYTFNDDKGTTYTYDFNGLKVYSFIDPYLGPLYRVNIDSLHVYDNLSKVDAYYEISVNFWAGVYFNGVYNISTTNTFDPSNAEYINNPSYTTNEKGIDYTFNSNGVYTADSKS